MMKPKYIITLELFLNRLDQGMNQLEALQAYGETCLHSTVSDLANKSGYEFTRKDEPHTHQNGGKTHFRRYWLKPELANKARKHISLYEKAPTATNETGLNDHSKKLDQAKCNPNPPLVESEPSSTLT